MRESMNDNHPENFDYVRCAIDHGTPIYAELIGDDATGFYWRTLNLSSARGVIRRLLPGTNATNYLFDLEPWRIGSGEGDMWLAPLPTPSKIASESLSLTTLCPRIAKAAIRRKPTKQSASWLASRLRSTWTFRYAACEAAGIQTDRTNNALYCKEI